MEKIYKRKRRHKSILKAIQIQINRKKYKSEKIFGDGKSAQKND